jgi:hypothetical protein
LQINIVKEAYLVEYSHSDKKVPQRRTEGTQNKRELTRNDTKYREGKEDVRKKKKLRH